MRCRYSLEQGGHWGGPSLWKRVRVLQSVLHSSEEGGRVASDLWSASIEPLSHVTEVQDAYSQTGRVSNQVRGLVCHNRSKRCILPYLHPSHSLTHRKFLRFGFGCKAFGLALSPRTFRKCVDAVLAPLRLQGIRILNYIDAVCFFPVPEFWREWAGTRSIYFGSTVLAGPSMVLGPDFSPWQLSMGDSHQEGALLTGGGLSPPPGNVEVMGVAPEGA